MKNFGQTIDFPSQLCTLAVFKPLELSDVNV
jgi:hypothetical protein